MTFIGHSLSGITIGILGLPKESSKAWKWIYFMVMIAIANLPDFPVKNWGHDRYDISHSIFVTLLGILLILLWYWISGIKASIKNTPYTASMAWLSHLLLDSFYNHGYGVSIFWPFSDKSLNLAIPWFSILPDQFSVNSIRIYTIEFLFYGLAMISLISLKELFLDAMRSRRKKIDTVDSHK